MSESKRSEAKGGDDEEKEQAGDFFIEELVKFTNTTDYVSKVQNFMQDNCAGFETYYERVKSGEGNKLEWMNIFFKYQELVDDQLGSFCKVHGSNPSEIFALIEGYLSKTDDKDFIPLFLKTMSEEHFFEQMYLYSSEKLRENDVYETLQHEEKGETSMSGFWYLVPESVDTDQLQNWLNVLGMPWPFKKLFMVAHKRPMKAIINHIPKTKCDISIAIPFFGTWSVSVNMDGKWSSCKDRLGRAIRVFGEEDQNGDVTLSVNGDGGGSLMMIFLSLTGPNSIRLHREFYSDGVDSGSLNASAVMTCSFRK